jgi:hypothetical protein
MTALPSLVSAEGEVVKALTAENLLHAAGITDPRIADLAAFAEFVDAADHLTSLARRRRRAWSATSWCYRMDRAGSGRSTRAT